MTIDLHGYRGKEATTKTMMTLLSFENDPHEYILEIITGKGTGALQQVVEDLLISEGYDWESGARTRGSYIINKQY